MSGRVIGAMQCVGFGREQGGHVPFGGLGSLRFSLISIPAGDWWSLADADTGIPGASSRHPWITYIDCEPGHAFMHVCLRSTTSPYSGSQALEGKPHPVGHEHTCCIDKRGWVGINTARPVDRDSVDRGKWSCSEPDSNHLAEIQRMIDEAELKRMIDGAGL